MDNNKMKTEIQRIRENYMEKDKAQLEYEMLRDLDREARRPATVFGYVFGSVSALVMGAGMSLIMTDIGGQLGLAHTMLIGILLGILGIVMASVNYPIYKSMLAADMGKYSDRIIELSEKMAEETPENN